MVETIYDYYVVIDFIEINFLNLFNFLSIKVNFCLIRQLLILQWLKCLLRQLS